MTPSLTVRSGAQSAQWWPSRALSTGH